MWANGNKRRNMTEYWFYLHDGSPRVLYRIVEGNGRRNKGEYFNSDHATWEPSEVIDRYIYFGEIGYERTTEAEALAFLRNNKI